MKEIIEQLVKAGCAYVAQDNVLFHVAAMKDYGKLSNRSLDEMIAGARVEVAPYKKDPMDFVLWKPSKPGEPSLAVAGRHHDARAARLAHRMLGHVLEASRRDLRHPRRRHRSGVSAPRERDRAIALRLPYATVMANYWMHNGFLQVEGEKMSKSLGNFVTIHDLLKDWPGEVVRLNMLRTHYRQPMDWTVKGLEESSKILDGWYDIVGDETNSSGSPDADFVSTLCDDLNTPNALTQLHRIAGEVRAQTAGSAQIELKRTLRASGMVVGLMAQSRRKFMQAYPRRATVDETKVGSLIEARSAARAKPKTSKNPTASATSSPPWASC